LFLDNLQNIQNGFGSALTFFNRLLDSFAVNFIVLSLLDNLKNKKLLKVWTKFIMTIVWKLRADLTPIDVWRTYKFSLKVLSTAVLRPFVKNITVWLLWVLATHIKTISIGRKNRICLLLLFDTFRWQLFGLSKHDQGRTHAEIRECNFIFLVNHVVNYKC
jgi:hypothetical protein